MLNPSATLRAEKTPYASNSEFSALLGELKSAARSSNNNAISLTILFRILNRLEFIVRWCPHNMAAMKSRLPNSVS